MLSDPERRVLAVHCSAHAVAVCDACQIGYKFSELRVEVMERSYYVCPACRLNLIDRIRLHILSCPVISAAVDERIARSFDVMKESARLSSQSAVLAVESQEIARRALDIKRKSSHVRREESVQDRITATLAGHQRICVACTALAAGTSPATVLEQIETIIKALRVTMRWGTCPSCKREHVMVIAFVAENPIP